MACFLRWGEWLWLRPHSLHRTSRIQCCPQNLTQCDWFLSEIYYLCGAWIKVWSSQLRENAHIEGRAYKIPTFYRGLECMYDVYTCIKTLQKAHSTGPITFLERSTIERVFIAVYLSISTASNYTLILVGLSRARHAESWDEKATH